MPLPRPLALVLSCEHAGNRVPREFRALFAPHSDLLASHRGWDPGALPIARAIAAALEAPLVFTSVTRLLVEPNRSPHHPSLFSTISRTLDPAARRRILELYYTPHRQEVRDHITRLAARGRRVLHVGIHTFTPVLAGRTRNADIGLLYDPRRSAEKHLCERWAQAIREIDPNLRVRRNYPYRGAADGLTTALRRELPPSRYMGIELEVNQAIATSPEPGTRHRLARTIVASLRLLLEPR